MIIFWVFVIGVLLGYMFGHFIKPNLRLRQAIQEARSTAVAALKEENKGVYRTIVTEQNQSSELVVEVRELAVTSGGQVKVDFLSAYYKNPAFRTRKGEALLREVRDLLGDYLPLTDIEWYEKTERHENLKKHLGALDDLHKQQFGS
ncbi:hypothetical protein I2I11_15585 [Pontibacter sp. 172403-2]|uniref:hypothetical protein n=1 Tax=Pontibacter rufus TaxID=2791028 RepID=UPI0018AFBCD0|nr:hypothetical protein [Pontibacter sp. 172403-2]MBF9254727.1 hypothetical protein [Pontibacter sp. 172403-2]